MRVLKSLALLVSFWAVLLFPRTFALSDDIAVVVGSEVILKSDVDEKVVLLKKFLDPTSVASVSDYDFRKKTVDTLIDTQLQINFAKKLGIELTPQEKTLAVDQFLMHQKSDRKTFEKNLRNEGIRPSLLYSS